MSGRPTFAETAKKMIEQRMQASGALHFSRVKAAIEFREARKDRDASAVAWQRENLPHWKVRPEAPVVRPQKTPRPCEVIEFQFSDGTMMTRCLGVFAGGPCAFGSGHSQPSLNSKRHKPEAVGVSAVGEVFAEYDEVTPEPEPVLIVEEGLLGEEAPEPIEPELTGEEDAEVRTMEESC